MVRPIFHKVHFSPEKIYELENYYFILFFFSEKKKKANPKKNLCWKANKMAGLNLSAASNNYISWNQTLCENKPVFSAAKTNQVDQESIVYSSLAALGGLTAAEPTPFVNPSFVEYPLAAPTTRVTATVETAAVVGSSFLNTTLPIPVAGMSILSQVAFMGAIPLDATSTAVADAEFHIVWPEGTTETTLVGLDVNVASTSTNAVNGVSGSAARPAVKVTRTTVLDPLSQTQVGASVTLVDLTLAGYTAGSTQVAIVAHFSLPNTSRLLL
jgi:hypothetical protein